jgi:hypothetical protein
MQTMAKFVAAHEITLTILGREGLQHDATGWEHYRFTVRLNRPDGRFIVAPWRQGTGITADPDAPMVLDALISDALAYEDASDEWEFYDNFGYTPSRESRRIWEHIKEMAPRVRDFLGGDFDTAAYETERL